MHPYVIFMQCSSSGLLIGHDETYCCTANTFDANHAMDVGRNSSLRSLDKKLSALDGW